MLTFGGLQAGLGDALALNAAGRTTRHAVVVLPSFSVGESLLAHYADRIPALEHRYLVAIGVLGRVESCEMVFVCSQEPCGEVLDYYFSMLPADRRESARRRFHVVPVPDDSHRSVAEKLLDHPAQLDEVRRIVGPLPRYVEPWIVTEHEVDVAVALQAPVNGAPPEVLAVAHKSAGRRLFREAGVPLPYGHEDVRSVDDVVAAAHDVQRCRPWATAVVVKHDDSGAGDGNAVIDLRGHVRADVEALPEWYLRDLRAGGVVEERVEGVAFSSPSAQVDVLPDGRVVVLATHEQELGGASSQVYMGCRFPADPAYSAELGRHALAVGEAMARRGAIGRMSIDFAVARDAQGRHGVHALEVNLRKGGTTHPYTVLRNNVPGSYDVEAGRWVTADGSTRVYRATDNLVNPAWLGLPPAAVLEAVGRRGLHIDPQRGTGVVLHGLAGLGVDGRFGLTAIGRDADHADELFDGARAAVEGSL